MTDRRCKIKQFVHEFFENDQCKLRILVDKYKDTFKQTDINILTEKDYRCAIQKLCMALFKQRPIREAYIAAFMGYAFETSRNIPLDVAADVVADALEKTDFIPNTKNSISFLIFISWFIVNIYLVYCK